ncbi:hypothetical protein J1G43_12505 [Cellulomonas sp. zg-ZUI22]|uniref:hypothetical protein n=1 Tax=Cellulomonas sp. zg-ZUI22 TaxID=2816955 RepID=UPI001A93C2D5|nr:hypothetical protein [Cellulomonas sp. zg-ZUI22]MBO0900787.1 hypothetical protein [Cellulomonas sp. zg-ZUI22]
MTAVSRHVRGVADLLGSAAALYLTAPLLLGIAVVPAALRSYQLYSGDPDVLLELVVELLRVVLVVAMVVVGRRWRGVAGHPWRQVRADVAHAYRVGWFGILVRLGVVTGAALAVGAGVEAVVTESSVRTVLSALVPDGAPARRVAVAVTFAVKNVVVIPVYVAALLIASGAVPAPPGVVAEDRQGPDRGADGP